LSRHQVRGPLRKRKGTAPMIYAFSEFLVMEGLLARKSLADPGYGSTSKMLGEAAICLALSKKDGQPGGFWTPSTLLGDTLIDAVRAKAGLSFQVIEM
jgi:hypothetical protein